MSFHEVGPMFILEGENPMKRREMIKLSLVLGGVVLLSSEGNETQAASHPTGGVYVPRQVIA